MESIVAVLLMTEAIGHQFHALFVDNAVLRKSQCTKVMDRLANRCNLNLALIEAAQVLLRELKGVTEPKWRSQKLSARRSSIILRKKPSLYTQTICNRAR